MRFLSRTLYRATARLRHDRRGLTVPEMIMLAAFVLIPVIIAVGGFGKTIIEALGGGVSSVKQESTTIKWKSQ